MTKHHKPRVSWGSQMGFLLAAIGSAIGLGNIWRFSYMTYENGGGAFLIPYLIALLTAGIPLMILEYGLGHKKHGSSSLAFAKIGRFFEWLGWWMPTFATFGIMLYYSVVIGWCVNYTGFSFNLGWGANTEYLHATFTQRTGWLAHYVAKNKNATSSLLAQAGVPVPPMRVVAEAAAAEQAAAELGWPVVVKPASEDMSKGVVAGITTVERLRTAFDAAAAMSPGRVMIEKHLPGDSHRPYRCLFKLPLAAVQENAEGLLHHTERHDVGESVVVEIS